jgi:hypothetical protein
METRIQTAIIVATILILEQPDVLHCFSCSVQIGAPEFAPVTTHIEPNIEPPFPMLDLSAFSITGAPVGPPGAGYILRDICGHDYEECPHLELRASAQHRPLTRTKALGSFGLRPVRTGYRQPVRKYAWRLVRKNCRRHEA